jgi:D-glycero-alpha-D-manno-heptose 1-phosphate guanylyltransferase
VLVQGARVISFGGEQNHGPGLINGGIYLLSPRIFSGVSSGAKFSFEREFLPGALPNLCVAAYEDSGYFIDMGVPMDFARAQIELQDN